MPGFGQMSGYVPPCFILQAYCHLHHGCEVYDLHLHPDSYDVQAWMHHRERQLFTLQ